jgi:hypothetical protein
MRSDNINLKDFFLKHTKSNNYLNVKAYKLILSKQFFILKLLKLFI